MVAHEHEPADSCCGCLGLMDLRTEGVEDEEAFTMGAPGVGMWHPPCLRAWKRGHAVGRAREDATT